MSFNFMAAVTIQSYFGDQENTVCHCFHFSPSICNEVKGPDAMILVFLCWVLKPAFSLSSFTLIKRLFSSSSLSAIRVVLSAYLRLLIFLLAILIPACASSSPAFKIMQKNEPNYMQQLEWITWSYFFKEKNPWCMCEHVLRCLEHINYSINVALSFLLNMRNYS